jgi:type VI secretion system protein
VARRLRVRGIPRHLATLLGVCAMLASSGCRSAVHTRDFAIRVNSRANNFSPVPVDLVLVKSKDVLAVVLSLTARDWFLRRAQILRDHPEDIEVLHWEFVPGQTIESERAKFQKGGGVALVVFANYLTPGSHRARIGNLKHFTLLLGSEGFRIDPNG